MKCCGRGAGGRGRQGKGGCVCPMLCVCGLACVVYIKPGPVLAGCVFIAGSGSGGSLCSRRAGTRRAGTGGGRAEYPGANRGLRGLLEMARAPNRPWPRARAALGGSGVRKGKEDLPEYHCCRSCSWFRSCLCVTGGESGKECCGALLWRSLACRSLLTFS